MAASSSRSLGSDPMDLDPPEGNTASGALIGAGDDDDDSISLTSTVPSEPKSEYEVETIYDERELEEGMKEYLVKWKGYPDVRCTWEPPEMFNNEETLRDWKKKRRAIQRGELPAFDREGWEDMVDAYWAAKDERKRRRRAKRIRLGLPVSPERDDDQESSEESPRPSESEKGQGAAQSESEGSDEPIARQIKKRPVTSSAPTQPGQSRNQNNGLQSSSNQNRNDLRSPISRQARQSSVRQHGSTTGTAPRLAPTTTASTARTSRNVRPRLPADKPVSFARGPARRRDLQSVVSRSRAQRAEGTGDGKQWKHMSTTRKYGQAARQEPEPDPSQLELRRPSDWATMSDAQALRRPNWRDTDSLFVEQDDDVMWDTPPQRPSDNQSSPRPSHVRTGSLHSRQEASWSSNLATPVSEQITRENTRNDGRRVSVPGKTSLQQGSEWSRSGKTVDSSGQVRRRYWKDGDLLCQVSYGTDKVEVGDVRVCNLPNRAFKEFMKLKHAHRIDVWFEELWTMEQYNSVFNMTGNGIILFNGWIEGYPDTSDGVEKLAQYLVEQDLVGIFRVPFESFVTVLFCYPAKSRSFGFLHGNTDVTQGESLRVAGWNGVFSADKFNAARLKQGKIPRETSIPQRPGRPERQGRFDETSKSGMVLLAAKTPLRIDTSPSNKDSRRDPPEKPAYLDTYSPKDPRRPSVDNPRDSPMREKTPYPDRFRRQPSWSVRSDAEVSSPNKDPRQPSGDLSRGPPSRRDSGGLSPDKEPRTPSSVQSRDLPSRKDSLLSLREPSRVQVLPPDKEQQTPSNVQSRDLPSRKDSLPSTKESDKEPQPPPSIKSPPHLRGLPPRPPPSVDSSDLASIKDPSQVEGLLPQLPTGVSSNNVSSTEGSSPDKEPQPIGDHPKGTDVEMTDIANNASAQADINLDEIFLNQFQITFRELALVSGLKTANMFFLLFPPEAQVECEILKKFLERHLVIVLSSLHDSLAWEKFSKAEIGVALFHHSFLNYQDLPSFTVLARKHQISFWNVSFLKTIDYVDRPIHFQRLFPHGGAFLLTEDFMVNERDATVIILTWFCDWVSRKQKGTWKLMLRPDIINWLLQKYGEDDRYIIMHKLILDIASEGNPNQIAVEPHDLDSIYNPFLEHPIISVANLPGYGSRSEDEHPAIPKGLTQEERNTDHLIEFFSGWAIVNAPNYRRFSVLTSQPLLPRWQNWHHIELFRGPEVFYKKEGIKPELFQKWLPQSSSSSSTNRPEGGSNSHRSQQPSSSLQESPIDRSPT
ncbi:hypothetical protein VTN77DRAFT_5557 [Rasamsonia byssochlamydoides]|uniref:uncharacterized protein n=1 Tax=Rasamsonia byssochlamydoides TaxID=89139 RepID=UPI0037424999